MVRVPLSELLKIQKSEKTKLRQCTTMWMDLGRTVLEERARFRIIFAMWDRKKHSKGIGPEQHSRKDFCLAHGQPEFNLWLSIWLLGPTKRRSLITVKCPSTPRK